MAGDRQPKRLNPCLDDRICFILNPTGKDTITAYLRLQTHDFPVVTVDLVPNSELMAEVEQAPIDAIARRLSSLASGSRAGGLSRS